MLLRPRRSVKLWFGLVMAAIGCARDTSRATPAAQATADDAEFARARERMVMEHLVPEGINDERVLAALRRVPRHRFVPDSLQQNAYEDRPLPIGHGRRSRNLSSSRS
jgi:hypothetical protein